MPPLGARRPAPLETRAVLCNSLFRHPAIPRLQCLQARLRKVTLFEPPMVPGALLPLHILISGSAVRPLGDDAKISEAQRSRPTLSRVPTSAIPCARSLPLQTAQRRPRRPLVFQLRSRPCRLLTLLLPPFLAHPRMGKHSRLLQALGVVPPPPPSPTSGRTVTPEEGVARTSEVLLPPPMF